jgi:putative FmdB family regulatory protein
VPTYSYRCTECDTAFDIQQAFTDHSLTVCPTCQGKLRKVFSSIGVTFSGSGFYSNDSKSGTSNPNLDRKSEQSGDKSDSSKPAETKSEKKSESTPAKTASPTPSTSVPTAKAS